MEKMTVVRPKKTPSAALRCGRVAIQHSFGGTVLVTPAAHGDRNATRRTTTLPFGVARFESQLSEPQRPTGVRGREVSV